MRSEHVGRSHSERQNSKEEGNLGRLWTSLQLTEVEATAKSDGHGAHLLLNLVANFLNHLLKLAQRLKEQLW